MRRDLRDKFAKIYIRDEISFPVQSPQKSCYIFREEELSREPIKWLKYLVMSCVGLEPIEKISSQIQRFNVSTLQQAKIWVSDRYSESSSQENQFMVVAKVVPWDRGAQLKNYRILQQADIDKKFNEVSDDFPDSTHEIWCCESSVAKEGLNLGGRLTFPKNSNMKQYLELVWFASPRMVESFTPKGFKYPYLRAFRINGYVPFEVETLYIPEEYQNSNQCDDDWLTDFKYVISTIFKKLKTIELLVGTLSTFGAQEVSFCFKFANGRLTIIDWDSEIESSA